VEILAKACEHSLVNCPYCRTGRYKTLSRVPILQFSADEKDLLRWLADKLHETRMRSGEPVRNLDDLRKCLLEWAERPRLRL
jgi:hypothetical protein